MIYAVMQKGSRVQVFVQASSRRVPAGSERGVAAEFPRQMSAVGDGLIFMRKDMH